MFTDALSLGPCGRHMRQGTLSRRGRHGFPRITDLVRNRAGLKPRDHSLVVRCPVAPSRWCGWPWANPVQGYQLSGLFRDQGFPRMWDFQD